MPGNSNLIVDQRVHLSYDQLRRAIQESATGLTHTHSQAQLLSEVRTCRKQIASPLDPAADRAPNSTDRARFAGREEVVISLPADTVTGNDEATSPSEIRLGPDLIAVALALSDELHLNEIDTAVLLSHARERAALRPDRDVVAAAKELSAVRRRQSVLYLQEILRAGLIASPSAPASQDDSFVTALVRERDILVAEHLVFHNVAQRIRTAWTASTTTNSQSEQHQQQQSQSFNPNPTASGTSAAESRTRLQPGELQLLAETIFLLAYTVQLSKDEAVLLRELLTEADQIYTELLSRERAAVRPSRSFPASFDTIASDGTKLSESSPPSEIVSPALVESESVRNLMLLSWMTALDRSRYQDVYNPRTGRSGVNQLLRDTSFLPHSTKVPKLESEDTELDPIRLLPKSIAAAELTAAIFRLAVANPDEQECVTTFVRLSAYNDALPFLADDLAAWIEKGAGSLSPDADLYADVFEDLAADIAEAPHVLTPLLQFVIHDVQYAAANTVYIPPDGPNMNNPPSTISTTPVQAATPSSARRARPASMSATPSASMLRRASVSNNTPQRGRPPLPPSGRQSTRRSSVRLPAETGRASSIGFGATPAAPYDVIEPSDDPATVQASRASSDNVLAALSRFVARAIALAPNKLSNQCTTGGLRYWSSLGPANWGLVNRIGDSVMDLWDLAMRNPYASGGVGLAFRQAIVGYLDFIASTCKKHDSPLHAFAALRFLAEGGHSVVSLDQLLRGLSVTNGQLGSIVSEQEAEVDEVDCDVLGGMLNVIANAAEALVDHGGIMSALGERGKELALHIGSLAIHNVPSKFREILIRCLAALGEQRPIATFLEIVAKDKAAPLRHYLRNTDAQTGEFTVTIRTLELASLAASWTLEEFPEVAIEAITICFAIEEVLRYWTRRKYVREAHRWEVVHAAGTLIRDVVYKDLTSPRSHRILAHLLTPAPGTGAASFLLRTLLCAAGLIRAGQDMMSNVSSLDPLMANLYRVSGRPSLTLAVDHGLGDAYRMMQEAVRTSSRIISLLLEVSPGRMSVPGVSIVSAAELLNGELASISAAASMVFHADSYLPQIMRAGYSDAVCGAVLAMLSRAARESENIASLFAKDVGAAGDSSAAEFRTSVAHIISHCDPSTETELAKNEMVNMSFNGQQEPTFTIESKHFPDPPLMHSALALVEACLGRDGSSKPGIFLLGLRLDSSNRYESTHYGVLGALVQLVANPSNGDIRIDSMSRATAATFLERLAANTVQSTSLAVLEHLKDLSNASDAVRGGGFADEMLFRVMDAFRMFEPHNMADGVNWTALGALVSSCLSLSALQVRLFPEHERDRCLAQHSRGLGHIAVGSDLSGRQDLNTVLPSPLDLLRVLDTMASSGGDLQVVSEAFRNWYLLLGTRLGVHEANDGYCQVPLLFEVANVVLEALSQAGTAHNLSGVLKKDGGEMAGSTVLSCIDRMRACDAVNSSLGEEFVSDAQSGTLLSGIIRSLGEVTGIGSNAARGRTSLYSALLICGQIAEKRVSDDVIGRALSRRVGQRSGTEVVISSACSDAVSGANAGTKCSGLAAICMMTRMDGVHAVAAMEAQGRLRKVVQVCLSDAKVRSMISEACWGGLDLAQYNPGVGGVSRTHAVALQAVVAVAEAVIGVIHAVSGSGHGMRLIAECGCVEAIAMLLPCVFFRGGASSYLPERGRTTVAIENTGATVNSKVDGMDLTGGEDNPTISTSPVGDDVVDQRRSLLCGLTGALAAAISCAGSSSVDYGSAFAISDGRNVLVEVLRAVRTPGCLELETISHIGLMMSRLADEVVMGSEGGAQICAFLTSVLSAVVPSTPSVTTVSVTPSGAPAGSQQVGDSRSPLSVGAAQQEPDSAREARRIRIMHPDGGSLFERDLIAARASCAQSIFASLRGVKRTIHLFRVDVDSGTMDGGHGAMFDQFDSGRGGGSDGNIKGVYRGKLSDIVRICRIMIREAERAAEESMQTESRLAGENGVSVATQRLQEVAEYCFEEFGIERESLTARVAMDCLKQTADNTRKHGAVCVSVFESGLLMLQEFVWTARSIVKGRYYNQHQPTPNRRRLSSSIISPQYHRHSIGDDGFNNGASPTSATGKKPATIMTMSQAERLIAWFESVVLPLCLEIEGVPEAVWCGKSSSFSRQVCRQIRTACTHDGSQANMSSTPSGGASASVTPATAPAGLAMSPASVAVGGGRPMSGRHRISFGTGWER